jgi:hypothetical protein
MANQDSVQDENQIQALILHTGTAATAETMKWAGSAGAAYVDLIGTEPVVVQIGTMTVGTLDLLKAGTITKLEQGSVQVTAGTMTAGTVDLLKAGTITRVEGGTLTVGNLPANLQGGTLGEVSVLALGTVKLNPRPNQSVLSYGTTFGGTAAGYGTMVGSAGTGTSIWVQGVSIVNSGGGTVTGLVGFGTELNGTSVLAKGDFGDQGGIQKSFTYPVNAGMTNADLVCYVGAAGTMDFNVSYFIAV